MQSSPHICPWQSLFSVKTDNFPKMSFRRSLVTVAVLFNLIHFSLAQELKFQNVEQLRQSLDRKQPESEPLTLLWGIADTTAYVGKVFKYTLPNDAFQGNVVHYSVVEAGKDRLPSFLSFNPLKAEISGIPMPKDKGQIYLEVTATGDDNSKVDDVFSIEVIDDNSLSIGSSGLAEKSVKHVRCKYEESKTSVTVIIDTDLDLLHPGDKVGLLENMAGHLNLSPEMLKLLPVADKPMFDNTALVSGPGNSKMPMHAGCMMSWLVGCGKVESDHMPVLQLLEKSATNGDMSGALGHNILGWQVTNTRFQEKPRRRRAAATATMKMNIPAPTKVTDLPPATDVTSTIAATSAAIMPTRTVDVMPTATVMTTSSVETTVTETSAQPEPTEPLPTKAYTMTSKTMTSTSTAPSSAVMSTTTTVMPTTTTGKITTPKPTRKPIGTPYCPPSGRGVKKAPRINQQMIDFKLMAGDVEKYKVPEDTFSDCYDQYTSDLDVEITFDDGLIVPKDFWLQLNKRSFKPYRIFANPLNTDTGSYDFIMKATNLYGKSSSQQFNVLVIGEDMSEKPASHELSVTVDMDYNKFMSSLSNRIEFSNKIARLYRDSNSKAMTVTRIDEGSVVYAWTNNTLASDSCPTSEIADLVKELITDDGKITPEAVQAMKPYKIKSAAVVPLGACADSPYFPVRDTKSRKPTTPKVQVTDKVTEKVTTPAAKTTTVQPTIKYSDKPKSTTIQEKTTTKTKVAAAGAGTGGGSDIWITTVVPAIVVLIVLIIALIIACCLYRKKRRGKMRLKEKNNFNNKGVPVIFADEYDEKPNDSSHPLIMQDEKPAMPPPEYQRASSETSGGSNSTQPMGDKEIEEYEMDTDITSPLYRPPPPVTASSNNKPPPSHVQSARNPPPYVPP